MYISDKNIKLPEDPDTIIWKYLDLSKFVDLLLYKKLFMSRSDKFEDQYEGTFSEPTYEEIKKLAKDNRIAKMWSSAAGTLMNMNRLPCGKFLRKKMKA
jgi:hypothetical protein